MNENLIKSSETTVLTNNLLNLGAEKHWYSFKSSSVTALRSEGLVNWCVCVYIYIDAYMYI